MPLMRKGVIVATGLAGALAAGQAPEFAQQYRQRLGGAIEELQTVVSRFDADAARNGLDRQQALERYALSDDTFLRDQGVSMRAAVDRFESLWAQAVRMQTMPDIARPLALARGYDQQLISGAWRDFEPAMPMTVHGLAWGAAGFGIFALIAAALGRLFFPRRRRSGPVRVR